MLESYMDLSFKIRPDGIFARCDQEPCDRSACEKNYLFSHKISI